MSEPTNWALLNRPKLCETNYTVKGNPTRSGGRSQYFFNLFPRMLRNLNQRTSGSFNIIVIGAPEFENDFFTIPYGRVVDLLTTSTLTKTGRWLIHIEHWDFMVFPGDVPGTGINVEPFYGIRC